MKKYFILLIGFVSFVMMARAQKTCVIASAENHVPIREALIHTDNNHWARTDYRGYFTIKYQFDSATVSKPGFVKTTIYLENLPDTVFMLPESKQIGEVTIWGKDQQHIRDLEKSVQQQVDSDGPRGNNSLLSGNFLGWLDRQGNRDRKHLKKARKIFGELDKKDPIVEAYEQATGKKVLHNPMGDVQKPEEEKEE